MAAPPTFALTTVANEITVLQLRQHNLQLRGIFLKRCILFDFFAVKFHVRRIVSFRLDLGTCEKAMKPAPGARRPALRLSHANTQRWCKLPHPPLSVAFQQL